MKAVDDMSVLDELMKEPEDDLATRMTREFSDAAEDIVVIVAGKHSRNGKPTQVEVNLRSSARRTVGDWMTRHMLAAEKWEEKMRVVNALREGLRNQDIVFRSAHDLETLDFMVILQLERLPHVVEHFINNGEFMDLMDAAFQAGIELGMSDYTVSRLRIGMFRLYRYDIEKEQENVLGKTYDGTMVPLEIRMNFSGFYEMGEEDISQAEWGYDQSSYPLDFNKDGGFYDLFGQK